VSRLRFFAALGLIALGGLGVRTAFVLGVARHDRHFYDAFYYELQAYALADGKGFTDPVAYLPGHDQVARPAADHPPLTAAALALVAWAFGRHTLVLRFTTALVGVATVVLLGLLGRAVAGERAGLIAAAIGALYPFLWLNDGLIMSESFAALLVTAALLLCYRLCARPNVALALGLGAVCGLAALTRAELALLAPGFVLVLVLAGRGPGRTWRPVLVDSMLVLLGAAVVISPWVLYNETRFDKTVLISSNDGITLLGSNCDAAYHGSEIGLWVIAPDVCIPSQSPPGDQSVVSAEYRHDAIGYARAHASRLPVVMAVRFGRTWNLFRPTDMLRVNEREGRPRWATASGLVVYYPLVALAIAGAIVLRRRGRGLAPLMVAPIIVTVTTLVFYGQTRLRLPAEPSIVVLAAVTSSLLWHRWSSARVNAGSQDEQVSRRRQSAVPAA
jgi:4-amino-4-deoxy-L-arabinose transferase-like glycosyltransferase